MASWSSVFAERDGGRVCILRCYQFAKGLYVEGLAGCHLEVDRQTVCSRQRTLRERMPHHSGRQAYRSREGTKIQQFSIRRAPGGSPN
jgi:hypothetical protein